MIIRLFPSEVVANVSVQVIVVYAGPILYLLVIVFQFIPTEIDSEFPESGHSRLYFHVFCWLDLDQCIFRNRTHNVSLKSPICSAFARGKSPRSCRMNFTFNFKVIKFSMCRFMFIIFGLLTSFTFFFFRLTLL